MTKNDVKLLALGLVVLTIAFLYFQGSGILFDEDYVSPDAYSYIEAARLLFEDAMPHPTRPLGFALIVGIPRVFLESMSTDTYLMYSLALNAMLWLATIFVLHKTLSLIASRRIAFWSTVIFIMCLGCVSSVFLLMTETVISLLFVSVSYYMAKYARDKRVSHLVYGVLVLNCTVLIRPGMLYFAGLVTLGLMVYLIKERKLYASVIVPLVIAFVLVGIQCMSMYKTYGNFTPSYIDKTTWYMYLGAESFAKAHGDDYMKERVKRSERLAMLTWSEKSEISKRDFIDQISDHPYIVLSEYFGNIGKNTSIGSSLLLQVKNRSAESVSTQSSNFIYGIASFLRVVTKLQNIGFVLLSVLGLVWAIMNWRRVNVLFLISIGCILYIILTSGIAFMQGDRFHIVFYPLTIIVVLYALMDRFKYAG